MLGWSDNRFHMCRMKDDAVAKALYNEVKDGSLIFVPERDEMRKCVQAIREQREKASRPAPRRPLQRAEADMVRSLHGNSPRVPQNLSNAQPFQTTPQTYRPAFNLRHNVVLLIPNAAQAASRSPS
jgi:hypothetical protein